MGAIATALGVSSNIAPMGSSYGRCARFDAVLPYFDSAHSAIAP